MNREIHNTVEPRVALNIQAISTDTTTVGNIIDLQGFDSGEFLIHSGVLTDGSYVPLIEDGNDSGLSDAAAVPDSDLTTTESDASFSDSDDNSVKRIGYTGSKRYLRLSLVSTGTTSGGTLGAAIMLSHAYAQPVAGN